MAIRVGTWTYYINIYKKKSKSDNKMILVIIGFQSTLGIVGWHNQNIFFNIFQYEIDLTHSKNCLSTKTPIHSNAQCSVIRNKYKVKHPIKCKSTIQQRLCINVCTRTVINAIQLWANLHWNRWNPFNLHLHLQHSIGSFSE